MSNKKSTFAPSIQQYIDVVWKQETEHGTAGEHCGHTEWPLPDHTGAGRRDVQGHAVAFSLVYLAFPPMFSFHRFERFQLY